MRRPSTSSPVALRAIVAALLFLLSGSLAAAAEPQADGAKPAQDLRIAVVDFGYLDTSGETRDQRREHETRLRDLMTALKRDLAAQGKVIVSLNCGAAPCSANTPAGVLVDAAREAGAGVLLVGGIHKMSTLIQWAKATAIDIATERLVFDKLFSFRGDDDESWRRAEVFIAGQLTATL